MSKSNNIVKLGSLISLLILLMPIVRYYNVPGTDIGSNSAILLFLFFLTPLVCLYNSQYIGGLKNKSVFRSSRSYFIFFLIWSVIITLYYEYGGLASGNFNNAIVAFLAGFVMIMLLTGRIDATKTFKIYEYFVYIVLIIYAIQWGLKLGGLSMDFRLPFHKFNGSWPFEDGMTFGMNAANTSIFSEPAHISEYLIPYLCYLLFCETDEKRKKYFSIIISLSIILTLSGTGIILVGIVWLLYFTLLSDKRGSRKIVLGVIGIILVVAVFFVMQTFEDYNTMFGKLFFSSNGSLEANKSSFRIYRGWDYVFKMPIANLLTGVGFVHMETFAMRNGLRSIFDNDFKLFEWFSGITEVILYFGIIGAIPFVMHIVKLYKNQSKYTKSIIIVFFSLLFTSQILFLETHLFYFILILGSIQSQRINQTVLKNVL